MSIQLTSRAREKGLKQVEMFSAYETDKYIACILYEKRIKQGEVIEWLDPAIIFKTPVKHKDYDKAVRLAEEAGIILLLPESKNFKTDYYGLEFNGHKSLVKSWGYTSNHVPVSRRWNRHYMLNRAELWIEDCKEAADIIQRILDLIFEGNSDETIIETIHSWLKEYQAV